jgi:hypothetical protein
MTGYFLDGSNLFGVTMVLTYQISDTREDETVASELECKIFGGDVRSRIVCRQGSVNVELVTSFD